MRPLGDILCNTEAQRLDDTLAFPNHRWFSAVGAVGPGTAHAGPYDWEYAHFIPFHGFRERSAFFVGDFTPPTGIYALFTIVPGPSAPMGSSPDSANGPIIPNALFPIATQGVLYRNGVVYDPNNNGQYPAESAFGFPSVAGASHVPFFFNDNVSWAPQPAPPVEGNYEWRITVRDTTSSGWDVVIPYVVSAAPNADGGVDGGCGDTQNDPANCGACGKSCGGGTCSSGFCQPLTIASGLGQPYSLVIDGTNAYVASGAVSKVPLSGGAVTTISGDLAQSVAVDANNVYWWWYLHGLEKAPLAGGPEVEIGASPTTGGFRIAVDATNVYWVDANGLQRVPIGGGTPTVLQSVSVGGVAVDATNVYWTQPNTGQLFKAAKAGGAPVALNVSLGGSEPLVVDASNVYVADGNTVWQVPIDGSAAVALTIVNGGLEPPLAIDSQYVYFTLGIAPSYQCSGLHRVPIGGGPVRQVANDQRVTSIAVDATSIYWANFNGTIMKLAK
jgi:hypothetical protein